MRELQLTNGIFRVLSLSLSLSLQIDESDGVKKDTTTHLGGVTFARLFGSFWHLWKQTGTAGGQQGGRTRIELCTRSRTVLCVYVSVGTRSRTTSV